MNDLKVDDLLDVTIRGARLMYATEDHAEGARTLTLVSHGGTKYVLLCQPGTVTIAKVEPRVSDERIQEILDRLNSLSAEGATLDVAVDWAVGQCEVATTGGPQAGRAEVELTDGTVLEFTPDQQRWVAQ